MSDPVAVWLNCGECGVGEAVAVPASQTSGVVKCWSCSGPVDVAHAFAHARWCVVCGDDLSECVCESVRGE